MTQRYDENLILAYLEGDMNTDEKVRFETMLAGDEPLRQLVQSLTEDRAALRNLPAEVPPTDLMQPVHERLERNMLLDSPAADTALPIARHRNRVSRLLAITALAALLMFVVGLVLHIWVFTFNLHDPSPSPGPAFDHLASSTPQTSGQPLAASTPSATTPTAIPVPSPTAGAQTPIVGSGASEPSTGSALASAAAPPAQTAPPTLAIKSARSLADANEPDIAKSEREVPVVTAAPSITWHNPSSRLGEKPQPQAGAGTVLALESNATFPEDNPPAGVTIQRVRVVAVDVKAAQADLRQWVITNTIINNALANNALANSTVAARTENEELGRQRMRTSGDSESQAHNQQPVIQRQQPIDSSADQLYPQYRVLDPAPATPDQSETSTVTNPRLSTGFEGKSKPSTAITSTSAMNLRLQADQLERLLTHLNRNQNAQQAKLIPSPVTLPEKIESSPAAPIPAAAPHATSSPQPADHRSKTPAWVDVIVEFVELTPSKLAPNQ